MYCSLNFSSIHLFPLSPFPKCWSLTHIQHSKLHLSICFQWIQPVIPQTHSDFHHHVHLLTCFFPQYPMTAFFTVFLLKANHFICALPLLTERDNSSNSFSPRHFFLFVKLLLSLLYYYFFNLCLGPFHRLRSCSAFFCKIINNLRLPIPLLSFPL